MRRGRSPDGVDAILALIGGKALTKCLDTLRRGGRLAYPNGIEPAPKKRRGITAKPYDAIAGRARTRAAGSGTHSGQDRFAHLPVAMRAPVDSLLENVVGNRADLEFPVCPLPGRLDPVRVAESADSDAINFAVAGDRRGPGHAAAPLGVLLRSVV
jgi:hypothetical protein